MCREHLVLECALGLCAAANAVGKMSLEWKVVHVKVATWYIVHLRKLSVLTYIIRLIHNIYQNIKCASFLVKILLLLCLIIILIFSFQDYSECIPLKNCTRKVARFYVYMLKKRSFGQFL